MRIGLDVDGVLADYVAGFNKLVLFKFGKILPYPATQWDWYDGLLTKEEEYALWQHMRASKFLESLDPLPQLYPAFLSELNEEHDLYFVTARSLPTAKTQTENWLEEHFGLSRSSVLTHIGNKGLVAGQLQLDIFLDDQPGNLLDIRDFSRAKPILMVQPYNAQVWGTMTEISDVSQLGPVVTQLKESSTSRDSCIQLC
jgi:5'(3')-deoxyribonucleotidase